MPIHYVPPPVQGLRAQQERLKKTGSQMAEMYGLAGNNQWRKYTTGQDPRPMSLPMLFLAGALQNRTATVDEVFDWCRRETGAVIDLDASTASPAVDGEPQP
ncbi:hypothetical protein SAMN05445504_2357 [Burkholderia sp. CF099]|nr:hypothetical protein SAMN05445504_2357 [Burkholderia sp. CF099]